LDWYARMTLPPYSATASKAAATSAETSHSQTTT
jgi:hypothetical protein